MNEREYAYCYFCSLRRTLKVRGEGQVLKHDFPS
jgi:hypothetical protein